MFLGQVDIAMSLPKLFSGVSKPSIVALQLADDLLKRSHSNENCYSSLATSKHKI